jgi:hypothetical protein
MEFKKCTKCGKEKSLNEFHLRFRSSNKKREVCKECVKEYHHQFYLKNKNRLFNQVRSFQATNKKVNFNYFVGRMYTKIKDRVNGNGRAKYKDLPVCTKEEFLKLAYGSLQLKKLYSDWRVCGYIHKYVPSVDRIDSEKGYTIENIQFLTLSENSKKGGG